MKLTYYIQLQNSTLKEWRYLKNKRVTVNRIIPIKFNKFCWIWPNISRSWPKLSMPSIYYSKFYLDGLEDIIRIIFKSDILMNFKYQPKIRKWPRPCPYLGKILSREPNDLESSFSNQNVRNRPTCNPWEGIFPYIVYFPHNSRNGSGVSIQFRKMCFLAKTAPRPGKAYHTIIWQFNYANHLTGPFCDFLNTITKWPRNIVSMVKPI